MDYYYRVCGVRFKSNIPLRLETAHSGPVEFKIIKSSRPVLTAKTLKIFKSLKRKNQLREALCNDQGELTVEIANRAQAKTIGHICRIFFNKNVGSDFDQANIIMYHILPHLIARPGRLVLHASAIRNNKKAVVFAGLSGSGKSTLASSLAQRGYNLLSDEFVTIELKGRRLYCAGSFTESRLNTDSLKLLKIAKHVNHAKHANHAKLANLAKNDTIHTHSTHGRNKDKTLTNRRRNDSKSCTPEILGQDRHKTVLKWISAIDKRPIQLDGLFLVDLKATSTKAELIKKLYENTFACNYKRPEALHKQYAIILQLINAIKPMPRKRLIGRLFERHLASSATSKVN